jgi:hypothetical protein
MKAQIKAKSKEITEKNTTFAEGGKGHVVGPQHAGLNEPGLSGKAPAGEGDDKFACGGPANETVGTGKAAPAKPGRSAP